MPYYVYILQSQLDNSYYTGMTTNLERRLKEHNAGHTITTAKHRPWKIIYYEELGSLEDARTRERYFKSAAGRRFRAKLLGIGSVDTRPTA